MRTLLLIASLSACLLAMPFDLEDDQCGAKAKAVPQYKFIASGNVGADFGCELCLDMVLIAETYAECDEAEVEHKMEQKCDKDYKGPADRACRSMVDEFGHDIITDTEQDPSKVCYKVIHKHCSYSLI